MSAVLTPRRSRRGDEREAGRFARQESLFGAYAPPAPAPTAPPAPSAPSEAERTAAASHAGLVEHAPAAPAHDHPAPTAISGPTLDEAISALWGELRTGAAVTCPACGAEAMQPRHSAGSGVVGGRCGACEATLS